MILFTTCPRCNSLWDSIKVHKCTCGLYVLYVSPTEGVLDYSLDNFCGYDIQWAMKEQECYIYVVGDNTDQYFILPFLPFDITEDQFKIYLTFL